MSLKVPTDAAIEGWLKTLGVKSIVEWDTVVFLYRYHASLMTAEHIARMLGCATNEVINAMDSLEFVGLVERSRTSQGVRLYQFTRPIGPTRGDAFDGLMSIAESRAIRLFLARKWRRQASTLNTEHHLPKKVGKKRWLKAI